MRGDGVCVWEVWVCIVCKVCVPPPSTSRPPLQQVGTSGGRRGEMGPGGGGGSGGGGGDAEQPLRVAVAEAAEEVVRVVTLVAGGVGLANECWQSRRQHERVIVG